jgi:hypothetical protein
MLQGVSDAATTSACWKELTETRTGTMRGRPDRTISPGGHPEIEAFESCSVAAESVGLNVSVRDFHGNRIPRTEGTRRQTG